MKKRIGNDISFAWHIYRKDGDTQVPESFADKDVTIKLISPLQRTVTIEDVSIATGVVTFTFRGKHQVTLGNYVAVLLENKGEDGMVTLDVVDAVTLVPHSHMEEDGDDGDVIEAEAVDLESSISAGGGGGIEQQQADWAQTDDTAVDFIKNKPNLDVYCRKDATNVHTGGYDQYIYDFVESIGNVTIDAQALWVRLLYPNGELVSETRVGPGNIRIVKNGVTLNLNPAYFQALVEAITGIRAVIPEQASSSNQLADKDFVNSSIATATATFRGAFNLVTDLHLSVSATHAQIATALATTVQTADNNDYCYVQIPTADDTPTEFASVERYKFNGTDWSYEYTLNNSGFTAAQWAALNSGITSGLVAKLSDLPTATELAALLAGKASTQELEGKQDKMPIVQVASGTSAINAAVNTYYEVAGEVGTLAITLPTPTDLTKVAMVVIHLLAGTNPNVVIGAVDNPQPDFSAAYDISASKEYEINCLYNGDKWVVADMEVV